MMGATTANPKAAKYVRALLADWRKGHQDFSGKMAHPAPLPATTPLIQGAR